MNWNSVLVPLVIIFFTSQSSLAYSASFDCAKATTFVERSICTKVDLSELDDKLSITYKLILKNLVNKDFLIQDQLNWLRVSRNSCKEDPCILNAYRNRISALDIYASIVQEGSRSSIGKNLTIHGETPEARIVFLKIIENRAETLGDLEYRNVYFSKALSDSTPMVRKYAAYSLRGEKYIQQLINVLASDSNSEVRAHASDGLDHFLTDNGTTTCGGAIIVEKKSKTNIFSFV